MAQFDVYRLENGDLVVDCQSPQFDHYETRFVIPLIEAELGAVTMPRLHPRFNVNGEEVILVTQFATAIRARELRTHVASLDRDREKIIAALDVLIGAG